MTDKSDTREQILNAALERMAHYGYGKTTMAEIAKDCGMSAGNIYRFFKSKVDIAEAIFVRTSEDVLADMVKLTNGTGTGPEKLRALMMEELQGTFTRLNEREKALQIGEVLNQERPDLADERMDNERAVIAQVLEQGINEGLFKPVEDIDRVAEAVQNATMKFRFPQRFTSRNLPTLERELSAILDILIAGLAASPPQNPD